MKNKRYTEQQKKYISENHSKMSFKDLTENFNKEFNTNRTIIGIKAYMTRNNLEIGIKGRPPKYNNDHVEFVRKAVKEYTVQETADLMSEKFNMKVTLAAVSGLMMKHDIRVGEMRGLFEQGTEAWNKGRKQTDYMSPEAIEKTKATRFKKGQKSLNQRPIGSERFTKDGYIEIKTGEPSVWKLKHRANWEKEHGKIPQGKRILFLDGDRTNCDISNLKLVDYAIGAVMNRNNLYAVDDVELQKLGINLSKLIIKTTEREKQKNG